MTVQRMLNHSDPTDTNCNPLGILPIIATGVGAPDVIVFDGNVAAQLDVTDGGTDRTGWIISITATEDCWVALGSSSPTAAANTAGSFFLAKGAVLGPFDMKANEYIAAIKHTTAGTLSIMYHASRGSTNQGG